MAGYELATAYVTLAVESSEISTAIGRAFSTGDKIATKAGRSMGKAMGKAFEQEKGPDFEKLAAAAEKADERVKVSAQRLARQRADAARAVEIAEQKVIETREKSIARDRDVVRSEKALATARKQGDADAIAAAEEELARARRNATPTSADMAAEDRLAKAKRAYIDTSRDGVQTLARYRREQESANEKLQEAKRAADGADRSVDGAAGAFARLGERVKAAMKGDFAGAFRSVEREGQEAADEIERDFKRAGDDASRGFSSNFKAGFAGAAAGILGYVGVDQLWEVGKSAFTGAADLEQSIGAVSAVFKESQDQVLAWGEAADQTLGMSANSYNTLASTLGAQLKNLGVEDYTNQTNELITLGADLSAQFGGSTTEAVEALSSAMRGERDPIERYGISLNQAAIDAKAAELGFSKVDGAYDKQAQTAATLALITEQSADAQGAFARENGTTANTLQKLKARTEDMAAALGARLTPIFDKVGGWLLDKGIPALEDFGRGIEGVWTLLTTGDFTGAENLFGFEEDSAFVGFLFGVRDAALTLYDKVLKPIGTWVADNWQVIAGALGGLAAFFVGGAVVSAITAVAGAIGGFVAGIGWISVAIGTALTALGAFFTGTETGRAILAGFVGFVVDVLWPGIVGAFDAVKRVIAEVWPVVMQVFTAVRDYAVQVWQGVILPAFQQFTGFLQETVFPIVQRLWTEYIQPAFMAIGAFIVATWENAIKPALTAVAGFISNTLAPTVVWLWQNVISPAFTIIGQIIAWAWNSVIFPALDAMKWFISSVLVPTVLWLWHNVITPAWAGISKAIEVAWAVISLIFNVIKWTIENVLAPVFTWLWNNVISPAWDGIQDVLSTGWNWMKDHVFTPLKNFIQDDVAPAFQTGVDAIGRAWDGLKELAMSPVRFVVDSVINKGIIDNFNKVADVFGSKKISHLPVPGMPSSSSGRGGGRTRARAAFRTGGVLPGYTPGRDVHSFYSPTLGRLDLSGGEAIMRPEWTRAIGGPRAVEELNRRAVRGQAFATGGVFGAFKGGGVIGDLWRNAKQYGGDALDTLLEGFDFATEALSDPKGALMKIVNAVVGEMPAAGSFGTLAKGVPTKVVSTIADAITTTFAGSTPSGGGSGGTLSAAEALATSMGLVITSRGRRGARTAQNGLVSLHALGRAIDVAGTPSQMSAYFDAVDARWSPTELLYSPKGARNKHRSGRRYPNTGATLRNHYSHVHVGFKHGGVFDRPFLHDQGGWHEPGQLSLNMTRQPEAVLTDAQWATMHRLAAQNLATPGADVTRLSDEDRALLRELGNLKVVLDRREVGALVRDAGMANRRMGAR